MHAYIRMLFRGKKQADIRSTHQKRTALQANHDVGELWDWCGTETDIWHILLYLIEQNMISPSLQKDNINVPVHLILYITWRATNTNKSPWQCHRCTVQQSGLHWLLNTFPTPVWHSAGTSWHIQPAARAQYPLQPAPSSQDSNSSAGSCEELLCQSCPRYLQDKSVAAQQCCLGMQPKNNQEIQNY